MFLVLSAPAIPAHLRGYLSRFLIEPNPNLFVGNCSPRVRDKLWERACAANQGASMVMVWSDRSEQGYGIRTDGPQAPGTVELDGVVLLVRPQAAENRDAD